jgi:hypothetical protein
MLNCHILRVILAVMIATLSLNLVCYAEDFLQSFR